MSDTERVRAWRQRLKDGGLVPMTFWLGPETKAHYQDMAVQSHRRPSELAQLALDAYRLDPAAVAASVTDIAQLRALIREELDQTTAIITATVTATISETITTALPAMVEATLQRSVSAIVTATETETRQEPRVPASRGASVSDTEIATATDTIRTPPGQRKLTPRQAAGLRAKRARGAPIKALMQDYGLSKATVHRYLKAPPPVQRPRTRTAASVA